MNTLMACSAIGALTSAVCAGDIVFIKQARSIAVESTAVGTGGKATASDSASAPDFAPWSDYVSAIVFAPGAAAGIVGEASQSSELGQDVIKASLNADSFIGVGGCSGDCISLSATATLHFETTFVAPSTFHYTIQGALWGESYPSLMPSGAIAFALASSQGIVYEQPGEWGYTKLDDSGVVPPGTYTMIATGEFAPLANEEYAFMLISALLYMTQCPGDLDSDGATNATDIALLLGAWGDRRGVADIDASGLVDAADLAILLGSWGPCVTDSLCLASGHDCYTPGAPGCTDVNCCEYVCAFDPFCCEVEWDAICVDEAGQLCGIP